MTLFANHRSPKVLICSASSGHAAQKKPNLHDLLDHCLNTHTSAVTPRLARLLTQHTVFLSKPLPLSAYNNVINTDNSLLVCSSVYILGCETPASTLRLPVNTVKY